MSVTGLQESIQLFSNKTLKDPKVKALINLNDSGMIEVIELTATFELENGTSTDTPPSLADSVLSFFGGKKASVAQEETTDATTNLTTVIYLLL